MQVSPAGVFEEIDRTTFTKTPPLKVAFVIVETPATPEAAVTTIGDAVSVKFAAVEPTVAAITSECTVAPLVAVAVTVKLPTAVPLIVKVDAPEPPAILRRDKL